MVIADRASIPFHHNHVSMQSQSRRTIAAEKFAHFEKYPRAYCIETLLEMNGTSHKRLALNPKNGGFHDSTKKQFYEVSYRFREI